MMAGPGCASGLAVHGGTREPESAAGDVTHASYMAPWHHHGHPLRMLGVPQLPCGPLATPTIWQRPTPCHGLLIVAYRQDVYRTGGTSSALINLPSRQSGYLQPATTPCVCGIPDRVQSQIDTQLLHEMDRAAELQMAAGCGVPPQDEAVRTLTTSMPVCLLVDPRA